MSIMASSQPLTEGLWTVLWALGRPRFSSLLWAPEPGPPGHAQEAAKGDMNEFELERSEPRVLEPQY